MQNLSGEDKGKIMAGLLKSIAARVATMIKKVDSAQKAQEGYVIVEYRFL